METKESQIHKNIIVADSGASKAVWQQILNGKPAERSFETTGLNAFFLDEAGIVAWLKDEVISKLEDPKVDAVYYYGSGLNHEGNIKLLESAFKNVFPSCYVEAHNDTFGAARSLCQHEKGIACIIGTGSSTCLFDGKDITEDRSGLGYALGDEASGSYFGRKVLKSYLYGFFSPELKAKFFEQYGDLTRDEVLDCVYKKPFPSRWMAKFTMFLSANRGNEFIEKTLEEGFEDFITSHVMHHTGFENLKVHFVGSMSLAFKDVIEKVLKKHGLQSGNFQKNPLEGLVKFHSKTL